MDAPPTEPPAAAATDASPAPPSAGVASSGSKPKSKRVILRAADSSDDSSDDDAYDEDAVKRKAAEAAARAVAAAERGEEEESAPSESEEEDSDDDDEKSRRKKAKKSAAARKNPGIKRARKRPAPTSGGDAGEAPAPGKNLTVGELETQAVLQRLKAKRRKAEAYTEEKKQQISQQLLDNMLRAYVADVKALRNNQPATEKLRTLPQVLVHAKDLQLQTVLVQGGLWNRLFDWLRPTEGALPNVGLRTRLIDLIDGLACDNDNLESSGIGKMLNYMRTHKDETIENKRRINTILDRWTARLFG